MAANSSPPKRHFYKIKKKPTQFTNKSYHTYNANNNNKNFVMSELNKELRPLIRIDEQITHAESGIYTWIIKGEIDPHFYATRVFSQQEIGTLHQDIHRQTGSGSSPICAGELEVLLNGRIEFNIQSGTYTRDINTFRPTKEMALVMKPELHDSIKRDLLDFYENENRKENKNKIITRPVGSKPNNIKLEEIETILKMRRREAHYIKHRIIRRINLYKRNRMVAAVCQMLCSFFPPEQNNKCTKVAFLKGGDDKYDNDYIENGTLRPDADVLAGKSLLSREIITTNKNRTELNRIFKVNTLKKNHS